MGFWVSSPNLSVLVEEARSGILERVLEPTTGTPNTPRGRYSGWGTEPRPRNPPRCHSPVNLAEQRTVGWAGLCEDSNQPPVPHKQIHCLPAHL